jgi:hypothetical protein
MIHDGDEDEALISAENDWTEDSKGQEEMSGDQFKLAIFELADLWTKSLEPAEYVVFLDDLLAKLKGKGLGQNPPPAPSQATGQTRLTLTLEYMDDEVSPRAKISVTQREESFRKKVVSAGTKGASSQRAASRRATHTHEPLINDDPPPTSTSLVATPSQAITPRQASSLVETPPVPAPFPDLGVPDPPSTAVTPPRMMAPPAVSRGPARACAVLHVATDPSPAVTTLASADPIPELGAPRIPLGAPMQRMAAPLYSCADDQATSFVPPVSLHASEATPREQSRRSSDDEGRLFPRDDTVPTLRSRRSSQDATSPFSGHVPLQPVGLSLTMTSQSIASQPIEPISSQPLGLQPLGLQPLASQPLASQPPASQPLASQPLVSLPPAMPSLSTVSIPSQPIQPHPAASQQSTSPPTPSSPTVVPPSQSSFKRRAVQRGGAEVARRSSREYTLATGVSITAALTQTTVPPVEFSKLPAIAPTSAAEGPKRSFYGNLPLRQGGGERPKSRDRPRSRGGAAYADMDLMDFATPPPVDGVVHHSWRVAPDESQTPRRIRRNF